MNKSISEIAVKAILSDDALKEIKLAVNEIIDEELSKSDNMDCGLISECTDFLIELEENENPSFAMLIPFVSGEKVLNGLNKKGFKSLNKSLRGMMIVAAVLLFLISSNAVFAEISGINVFENISESIKSTLTELGIIDSSDQELVNETEKTEREINETVTEPTVEEVTETEVTVLNEPLKPSGVIKTLQKKDTKLNEAPMLHSIMLSFSNDFKTHYYYGEELKLEGLIVTAFYSDISQKNISISDCTVSGYKKNQVGAQTITVTYLNKSASFDIMLTKSSAAQDKFITGYEGTLPRDVYYTTNDTKLNIGDLRIRFIYSDGTYSNLFTSRDTLIIQNADFTKLGEQTVILRIHNEYSISYQITVTAADVYREIKSIYVDSNNIHEFSIGDRIEDINFTIRVTYQNNKSEYFNYFDVKDEVSIFGFDSSKATLETKLMKITFKGHSYSVNYTIITGKTVLRASFGENPETMPKFLYYKGEPLGVGKGIAADSVIPTLASSQNTEYSGTRNRDVFSGDGWCIYFKYLEKQYSGFYNEEMEQAWSDEVEIYGYDPYQEGYQLLDVYYEGYYLLSYTVFVYGDEGYVPADRPYDTIEYDSETLSSYKSTYFYNSLGNGKLEFVKAESGRKIGYKTNAHLESENIGINSVIMTFPDGKEYRYRTRYLYDVERAALIYPENTKFCPMIKAEELKNYSFDQFKVKLTLTNGEEIFLPVSDFKQSYLFSGRKLNLLEENLKSLFVYKVFYSDLNMISGPIELKVPCYVYSEGYEDAYSLSVFLRDVPLTVDADEEYFKTWSFAYLSSVDNDIDINTSDLIIKGVQWGTAGEYAAEIMYNFNGEMLKTDIDITITET